MKVGIVGVGVVGGAVRDFFSASDDVKAFDIAKPLDTIEEVRGADVIFVCVNTPTSCGRQDVSQLESACDSLRGVQVPVVIKSTVLPGTCRRLADKYGLAVVHNPEFLTERNAADDYAKQDLLIFSGPKLATDIVVGLHQSAGFVDSSFHVFNDYKVSETIKYMHNTFLATKVAFCNEIYDVCEHIGIQYDDVIRSVVALGGIGAGHTRVPGPDGKRGFSGMCFPKDTQAFYCWARALGLNPTALRGAIVSNEFVRPHGADCKPLEIK